MTSPFVGWGSPGKTAATAKTKEATEAGAQFHGLVQQRIGMTLRAITSPEQHPIPRRASVISILWWSGIVWLIIIMNRILLGSTSKISAKTAQKNRKNKTNHRIDDEHEEKENRSTMFLKMTADNQSNRENQRTRGNKTEDVKYRESSPPANQCAV